MKKLPGQFMPKTFQNRLIWMHVIYNYCARMIRWCTARHSLHLALQEDRLGQHTTADKAQLKPCFEQADPVHTSSHFYDSVVQSINIRWLSDINRSLKPVPSADRFLEYAIISGRLQLSSWIFISPRQRTWYCLVTSSWHVRSWCKSLSYI